MVIWRSRSDLLSCSSVEVCLTCKVMKRRHFIGSFAIGGLGTALAEGGPSVIKPSLVTTPLCVMTHRGVVTSDGLITDGPPSASAVPRPPIAKDPMKCLRFMTLQVRQTSTDEQESKSERDLQMTTFLFPDRKLKP